LSFHILSFLTPEIRPDYSHFTRPRFVSPDLTDILNIGKCNRTWHALVWGLPVWENIVFYAKPATRTPISFGPDACTRALREQSLRAVKHLELQAEDEQHLATLSLFPGLETFTSQIWGSPRVLEAALLGLPADIKHLYLQEHAILSQCNLSVLSRFEKLKSLDVSYTPLGSEFLLYLPETLEELDIRGTLLTIEDGEALAKFPKLSKLTFRQAKPGVAQSLLAHAPKTLSHLDMGWTDLAAIDPQILRRFPGLHTFSPLTRTVYDEEFQTPSLINAVLMGLHPEALQHLIADVDFGSARLGQENLAVFETIQGWKNLVLPDSLDTPGILGEIIRIASPTLEHLAFKKCENDRGLTMRFKDFDLRLLRQCVQLKTFNEGTYFSLTINDVEHLPSSMTHLNLSAPNCNWFTEVSHPAYGRFKNLTSLGLVRIGKIEYAAEALQNVSPHHVREIHLNPDHVSDHPETFLPLLARFYNLQKVFCPSHGLLISDLLRDRLKHLMPTVRWVISDYNFCFDIF